jgi:hypothetical protein
MKIPRSFQLFGRTITIVNKPLGGETCAQWEARKDLITIDPDLPRELREHSCIHEAMHAWLDALGRDELSTDEGFVDGLAGLIHQYLKTAK